MTWARNPPAMSQRVDYLKEVRFEWPGFLGFLTVLGLTQTDSNGIVLCISFGVMHEMCNATQQRGSMP